MRRTRLLELCLVATGLAGGMAFYKRFGFFLAYVSSLGAIRK